MNELLPQEALVLETLNIQPTEVQRASSRAFDVRFKYEMRYYPDAAIAGKTVKVKHFGRTDIPMRQFTMPLASELQHFRASAWFPLLLLRLAFDAHTDEVCRMAFGSPLPPYAGDWSFIRDQEPEAIWGLFHSVANRWFTTREAAKAFAQP